MGTLYNIIKQLCDERGIKGAKMCSDLGISKGLLTDLKMGRRQGVSAKTAQKVADYFGVSVGYLLGEETNKKTPTENDERLSEFYELFSKLPDELQARELAYLKELLNGLNK